MKWTNTLISSAIAFLAACAGPAFGAEDPVKPANPPVADTTASTANKTPLVVHNPDGSVTIRKEPVKTAEGTDPKVKKGLVIHAQTIVPTAPAPEKK